MTPDFFRTGSAGLMAWICSVKTAIASSEGVRCRMCSFSVRSKSGLKACEEVVIGSHPCQPHVLLQPKVGCPLAISTHTHSC